uniref:Uncharacterized protein n=1 Tax=Streptomyces sp. CNQ-418 TaxID=467194 RepID=J7H560_9ACTN|nr:hypothetical protein [Streptomyces sp. CNQ-418]
MTGRIHLLNDHLQVRRSSPAMTNGQPVHDLVVAGPWIIGKDRNGNITKWSLRTFDLVDYVDACTAYGTGRDTNRPTAEHTLAYWRGQICTGDGAGRFITLEATSLAMDATRPPLAGVGPLVSLCLDHPRVHSAVEVSGRVLLGSLDTGRFDAVETLGSGQVHSMHYDDRHDRFLAVKSDGEALGLRHGVTLLALDGSVECEFLFARHEVDFLEFSPDGATMYAGGSDGLLYVIDNTTLQPRITGTVGGFPGRVTDVTVGDDGSLFVLTLSGELVRVGPELDCVQDRALALRQAVWDVSSAWDEPGRWYCGTDDGVAVVEARTPPAGSPVLTEVGHHPARFGAVHKVATLSGGYVGIGQRQTVFRADALGKPLWSVTLEDAGYSVSVTPDHKRLLVATGIGAVELDADAGVELEWLSLDGRPITTACYGPDGERVLGNQDGAVCAFDPLTRDELWWLETGHSVERIWFQEGAVYVCGAGGLVAYSPVRGMVTERWGSGRCATRAAAVVGERVFLACDQRELHIFDRVTGEPWDIQNDLPDQPQMLTALTGPEGGRHLLAGGVGGWLCTYPLTENRLPARARQTWLTRRLGRSYALSRE